MISDVLYNDVVKITGLFLDGDRAFVLPNKKIIVKIKASFYMQSEEKWKPLCISFESESKLIFEYETEAGGGDYYNLSWSKDERYFALTDISRWYEDLYFIDLENKELIYSIIVQEKH